MPDSAYPTLFSPCTIGGLTVRNRLAHASIQTRFARDNEVTDELLNYYGARARGGTGLIVSEPLAMTSYNRDRDRLRAWDDAGLDGLRRLADTVESAGTRLLGQVQDSGRGRHSIGRNDGAVGASALPDDLSWTVPRVLSADGIRRMIDEWATASQRLQIAGFSGVEISAGHGHIFHQFLSPWANCRSDTFGGELEGRTRFLVELIHAIRARCESPFIIGVKLPAADGIDGSIDLAEARRIAQQVAATEEVDYWTWVWGAHANTLWWHLPDAHGDRHPYLDPIRELRSTGPDIPTGAIGYMTDPTECEKALTDGTADLAFLGRPLITDAAFGHKAERGDDATIRYCVSCNSCWRSIIEGGRLACDNNPRVGVANEERWSPRPAAKTHRLVVVGAGISGLEAAHTAASRGHDVTLFGAGHEVGGKTRLHAELPGGENLSSIYDYQYLAAKTAGVTFILGRVATVADVLALDPDRVLLATGSRMSVPPFLPEEYVDAGFVPNAREMAVAMLARTGRESGRAVLYDRDHTEMTYALAELLADRFDRLTVVTPRERLASDVSLINRQGIYHRLSNQGVEMLTNVDIDDLDSIENGVIRLRNVWSGALTLIDHVVSLSYSTARVPEQSLLAPLTASGVEVELIGDCRAPRSVMAATREGYDVAMAL